MNKEKIKFLREQGFSEKAITYLKKDINVGKIENPDVVADYTGKCGDIIKIYLEVKKGIIINAKFIYTGCMGVAASGSAIVELAKGKTLEEARKLSLQDIIEFYKDGNKGFPKQKYDCCEIAIGSLRNAIKKYKR
jgi:NifU-like protein involved in Fe-S cluster formation